jgi:hypothetical protein
MFLVLPQHERHIYILLLSRHYFSVAAVNVFTCSSSGKTHYYTADVSVQWFVKNSVASLVKKKRSIDKAERILLSFP